MNFPKSNFQRNFGTFSDGLISKIFDESMENIDKDQHISTEDYKVTRHLPPSNHLKNVEQRILKTKTERN